MVARIAPAILELLADGVPRPKAAIVKALAHLRHDRVGDGFPLPQGEVLANHGLVVLGLYQQPVDAAYLDLADVNGRLSGSTSNSPAHSQTCHG